MKKKQGYPNLNRYHLSAVTIPDELHFFTRLPLEIQFVIAKKPERLHTFRQLLEQGFGIGVRTVNQTPETVLASVDLLSQRTQENTVIPWLPRLLQSGEWPMFSDADVLAAKADGVDLAEQVRTILDRRQDFKKIVLIDLHNAGLSEAQRNIVRELNEDLYPLAVDYIVNRVLFDNAHARTEIAQSIIKALLFVGPIAHALEHWFRGVGKIFAASADDLLSETAELMALRGSGFTWRQLARRSRILVPVFMLATWGAFSVEGLIERGHVPLAGIVFGLSAVALSLTTALQSVGMYKHAFQKLAASGKLPSPQNTSLLSLALRQDFTNPARLGLFVGAVSSPLLAAITFTFFTSYVHNGWLLALLGSVESIVAGCTVIAAARINRRLFRQRIKKAIVQDLRIAV